MRIFLPLLAGLLLALVCGDVTAQTIVNPGALDQLQTPPPKPPARPASRPAPRPVPRRTPPAKPAAVAHPTAPPPPPEAPAQPVVPVAPPPPPVIPEAVAVPVRPAPTPAPPTIAADAPGDATKMPDGLRVTFGTDRADLNPASDAALRALVHEAGSAAGTTYTVTAFAAGMPEDPSTPRRLSLSRALTVRSVLIEEGIASIRIYVKALGATTPAAADGPPDRVDIVVGHTAEASSQTPASQTAAPAKATP